MFEKMGKARVRWQEACVVAEGGFLKRVIDTNSTLHGTFFSQTQTVPQKQHTYPPQMGPQILKSAGARILLDKNRIWAPWPNICFYDHTVNGRKKDVNMRSALWKNSFLRRTTFLGWEPHVWGQMLYTTCILGGSMGCFCFFCISTLFMFLEPKKVGPNEEKMVHFQGPMFRYGPLPNSPNGPSRTEKKGPILGLGCGTRPWGWPCMHGIIRFSTLREKWTRLFFFLTAPRKPCFLQHLSRESQHF